MEVLKKEDELDLDQKMRDAYGYPSINAMFDFC
jgi:hypothetical protein